jgi:3-deoxy-D-manno-octulosonic acid kinase
MRDDSGLRIATASGAILADATCLGSLLGACGEAVFDPRFWAERSELAAATAGRGSAWFLDSGARHWVLRHFRRGGFIAHLSDDQYFWTGEARVRAFAEYRLLARLIERGLPVPRPIGARYQRAGLRYRCDLITERVEGAAALSAELVERALSDQAWRSIGAAIARLHQAGVDHADLNAHNILIDRHDTVSVIDFDRGRIRAAGVWRLSNLRRLRRSLEKVSRDLPPGRFCPQAWACLLMGYSGSPARKSAGL